MLYSTTYTESYLLEPTKNNIKQVSYEDISSELIESNEEKKIKASDLLVKCLETERCRIHLWHSRRRKYWFYDECTGIRDSCTTEISNNHSCMMWWRLGTHFTQTSRWVWEIRLYSV